MKVYILATVHITSAGDYSTLLDVFLNKDDAINRAKRNAEGQKVIERETMTGWLEYNGESILLIPGLKQEDVPLFCIKTETVMKKQQIEAVTYRAVFEKEAE